MQMLLSGDTVDLSDIKGLKVDKHSTGGVGDKTTGVAPLPPPAGSSSENVGTRSGTLARHYDKLESIPGFNASLADVILLILSITQDSV